MRKFFYTLLVLVVCSITTFAQEVLSKLRQIPQVSGIEKMDVDSFEEYYRFWFEQPIDHTDPARGTFKQQVLLGHKKTDAPVVAILEGYKIYGPNATELTELFNTNQITVEHRFFNQSVPEGGIPWDYLTIKQAATDHHEIIQALKKSIYPDVKWMTTGISKGGQTTIFHRYFYPQDVDISVPYVAPLNLSYVDPRLEKFLSSLGTTRKNMESIFGGGGQQEECHWKIRDFQLLCFKNMEKLLPLLEQSVKERGYTFEMAGGTQRALQLVILEYPFAFWQWGYSCVNIPTEETAAWETIYEHLVQVSAPSFFSDKDIIELQPFYYAALTEIGMYDYNIKPFKKFLNDKENIDFSFTMPKDASPKPFNTEQMREINKWLQTDAERMLFVYGGSDPWFATAVDLKNNDKCRKYVRGDMDHKCRIKDFDPVSKEDLVFTLKEWLKE